MAEIYGRLTRKPGVIIGQGPWVLGNGLIGTLEAYFSSSPMLLLTDFSDMPAFSLHGPYQSGTGGYGNWDARQGFRSITKQVVEAHDPASAVHGTQLALKHALAGRPGPVAVLYSISAFSKPVEPDALLRLYPTRHYLPPLPPLPPVERTRRALDAIRAARRPVIIAGNGVRLAGAFEQLRELAEALDAPVVTTPSGKGCIAETHPLALGVFGTFGTPGANSCVSDADLAIVIGSKLTASDTARENPLLLDPERQTFIQVDVEPLNASWTFPVKHQLIGDAAGIVSELVRLAGELGCPSNDGSARVRAIREASGPDAGPSCEDELPMAPQRLVQELQEALPEDAIVTCDAGENRIFMTHFYATKRAGGFLQAAGAGPMGYAIPAALSAKMLNPNRPVVAVCGDGGFAMSMNGLMTAVEQRLPIIIIIFNNRMLGWSAHLRGDFGTQFHDFDHAAIARSMECEGYRARSPGEFAEAVQAALASKRPAVIDVIVSTRLSYADVTSPLANRA